MRVRQLIETSELELALVAGASGIDREIEWFAITEVVDVGPWVEGGELLLCTGVNMTRRAEQQREYVRNIAASGVSALAFGSGVRHETVPKALCAEAETLGLPVLDVPYHIPFIRITRAIQAAQLEQRRLVENRTISVNDRLTAAALYSGDRVNETLWIAAAELGLGLTLRSVQTETTLATAGPPPGAGGESRTLPILIEPEIAVAELTATCSNPIGRFEQQVLRHLAVTLTFVFAQQSAVTASTLRLAGDLISDVESARIGEDELSSRLAAFGLDPAARFAVFHVPAGDGTARALLPLLERGLRRTRGRYVTSVANEAVTFIAQVADDSAAMEVAEEIHRHAADTRVGVGRVVPPRELATSISEARACLRERTVRPVVSFRDLRPIGPLLTLPEATLRRYAQEVLGEELLRQPKLVASLLALVENFGHLSNTADALGIHRHTLRYRLDQISELTGLDATRSENLNELWMAAQALHAMELAEPPTPTP